MWRLSPGQQLRHRVWDRECALYNDLSGDTHVLGSDALAVLLALRAGAAGLPALALVLRRTADDAALTRLLADLERLALIEASAC